MSSIPDVCLIGDVVVDITENQYSQEKNKLRFGGIIHAARGLWANDALYSANYFCPQYLDESIIHYLKSISCDSFVKLGNVLGAPYLFLIREAKETGNQGYEFILRDEIKIENDIVSLEELKVLPCKDILLISGNYSLREISSYCNPEANIHIDLANNIDNIAYLEFFKRKLTTLFLSTSSQLFQLNYKGDFVAFSRIFEPYCECFVLKENRGGSRAIIYSENEILNIPSQTRPIVHSIGVGDVFDATFVSNYRRYSLKESLFLSSWIAAEYASTTFPKDFKNSVKRIMSSNISQLEELGGILLPWEAREKINIYIAAPDFDYVNTHNIDILCDSLTYHNFKPRRPVKENGQMEKGAPLSKRQELFSKDMELLNSCQMLIAVIIGNDPGTFIEIGVAASKGVPTLVYDPFDQADNCFLTQIPDFISNDLDEIISEVFSFGSKLELP